MDRKKFLGYKCLKTGIVDTEPKLAKVRSLPLECQWKIEIFVPINIGKLRCVDFKESTSVSVKFTFETSIIETSTMLIIVDQDAKLGE